MRQGTKSQEMDNAMKELRTQNTKKIILKSITMLDDESITKILEKADWNLRKAIEAFYAAKFKVNCVYIFYVILSIYMFVIYVCFYNYNQVKIDKKDKKLSEVQSIRINNLQNFGLKKYEFATIMMERINAIKNVGLDNIEIQYQRIVSGIGRLNSMQIEGVSFENGENDGNGNENGGQAILDLSIAKPYDPSKPKLNNKRKAKRKNNPEIKSVKSPLLAKEFKY